MLLILLFCCVVAIVNNLFCYCVFLFVNCVVIVVNFVVLLLLLLVVLFCVLFVCKCVLYYCHQVATKCVLYYCHQVATKCVLYYCHQVATKCVLYYCHRVSNQLQFTNISYHTRAVRKVSSYAISHLMYIMFVTSYVPVTVVLHYFPQNSVPFILFHLPTYILPYFCVSSSGILSFICYKIRPSKPIFFSERTPDVFIMYLYYFASLFLTQKTTYKKQSIYYILTYLLTHSTVQSPS